LKRDTTAELVRFCEFSRLERRGAFLEEAAAATAFEKMRELEDSQTDKLETGWPKDKPFRRRGQAGSYKDEMPEAAQSAFLAYSSKTLVECGYAEKPFSPLR
jgi:hypothetical protein